MALELKEVFKYLGIPDDAKVESLEDFKGVFDTKYFSETNLNESEGWKKHVGKINGTFVHHISKAAKAFEIKVDPAQFDNNPEKVFDFVLKSLQEKNNSIVAELEGKAGQGNDEKVKELSGQLEKLKNTKTELESALSASKQEFETAKGTFNTNLKNEKLNVRRGVQFGNVKFKKDITDIERKGFESIITSKYKFDLDENEALIVTDAEGKRIRSGDVHSAFKTPDQVLKEEAIAAKLYQTNPDGGEQRGTGANGTGTGPKWGNFKKDEGAAANDTKVKSQNVIAATVYDQQ